MRKAAAVALGILLLAPTARAEEEEKKFQTDLEVVAGAGEVEALNIVPTGFTTGGLRYERGLTNVTAVGIVLSGRYELSNHFSLGVRFPVAVGDLRPDSDTSRGTANLGNIEVEAEYETELGEHAVLFFGAHVAAPTSSGSDETLAGNQANIDPVEQSRELRVRKREHRAVARGISRAHSRGGREAPLWSIAHRAVREARVDVLRTTRG
jgi:IS5 family transposase